VKIVIIIVFSRIQPLTVLTVAQSFIFLHGNAVSGSMKYLKKTLKTEIFHEIFQRQKTCFFYISTLHSSQPFTLTVTGTQEDV